MKKHTVLLLILGVVFFLPATTPASAFIDFYRRPANISTLAGGHDGGDFDSVQALDANTYDVSEVAATPGFNIHLNFTVPSAPDQVTIHAYYDGNLGHTVNVDAYNFTGSTWITLGQIPDGASITEYNFSLNTPYSSFVSGEIVWVRIQHITAGSPLHDIFIDYAYVSGTYSIWDIIQGWFTHDLDNDQPEFYNWYESTALETPDENVSFFAVINDIDNTSAELNVTFYWSTDMFVSNNTPVTMTFDVEVLRYYPRYEYVFPAQSSGAVIWFYYRVNDGTTTRTKYDTDGAFFKAQWGDAINFDGGQRFQQVPFFGALMSDTTLFFFSMLLIVLGILGSASYINMKYMKQHNIQYRTIIPPILTRSVRGIARTSDRAIRRTGTFVADLVYFTMPEQYKQMRHSSSRKQIKSGLKAQLGFADKTKLQKQLPSSKGLKSQTPQPRVTRPSASSLIPSEVKRETSKLRTKWNKAKRDRRNL